MTSVVIPAHDEAPVIGRCLSTLLATAEPDEMQVVVVANGCTDETAAIARSFAGVEVVEIDEASKAAALRHGDSVADRWPRLYVDADVRITTEAARATASLLAGRQVYAAAPRLDVDTTGASWPVRAYYRIYLQVPYTQAGLVGAGVYGLSEPGHERIGTFPDLLADDLYVSRSFLASERATTPGHRFTIDAPPDFRTLVRVKARAALGTAQLDRAAQGAQPAHEPRRRSWRTYARIVGTPRQWPALAVYCAAYAATRATARRRLERDDLSWTSQRARPVSTSA